jgi:hypothetical protein
MAATKPVRLQAPARIGAAAFPQGAAFALAPVQWARASAPLWLAMPSLLSLLQGYPPRLPS